MKTIFNKICFETNTTFNKKKLNASHLIYFNCQTLVISYVLNKIVKVVLLVIKVTFIFLNFIYFKINNCFIK